MASRSPAWIIQARVRETSAVESGMALLSGSMACSIRSLRPGLASLVCCCPPRARKRAPRTELGVTTAAPKKKTTITMVTNTTIVKIRGNIDTPASLDLLLSNLDPDDLPDHEISHRLQSDPADQQRVADGIGKERLNEGRIERHHDHHNDRRHTHQQRHGEAPLGGVDAHLALNLETLPDHVREVVENLGQIASSL